MHVDGRRLPRAQAYSWPHARLASPLGHSTSILTGAASETMREAIREAITEAISEAITITMHIRTQA